MTTSYATLTTPVTQAQYLAQILATLAAQGFPVTAWQSGNAGRTLAVADAAALTDLRAVIADVARGGYLDTATGDWLTLLAAGLFDITRTAAVYAVGSVTLACVSTAGPYSITAGALVVTDGTRRWRSTNTTTKTVPSGGSVVVDVRAESPGTAYNVSGSLLSTTPVSPSLAGVTVTAASSWLTTAGAAEESDASLRARCRARWGTLGRGANDSAYVYWARTGHSAAADVTRAAVVWGAGDGKLTVYLAGPAGAVSGGTVSTVDAWLDINKPGTDDPTTASATARVVSLIATVTVDAASDSTANRALATDALTDYFAGLDIGGDVDLGRLYEAFYAAAGIIDVDITQPATDTSVNNDEIATLSASITWVVQ